MREILFRAKKYEKSVFDETDWVYGSLIDSGNHEQIFIYPWLNGASTMSCRQLVYARMETVNPETVGQFTGKVDKNGKKIFEGDIVRVCLDPEVCVGDVIWDSEIASYNIPFNNGKCVLPLDIFIAKNKVGDKVWIEVIGNIHDNPELIPC